MGVQNGANQRLKLPSAVGFLRGILRLRGKAANNGELASRLGAWKWGLGVITALPQAGCNISPIEASAQLQPTGTQSMGTQLWQLESFTLAHKSHTGGLGRGEVR